MPKLISLTFEAAQALEHEGKGQGGWQKKKNVGKEPLQAVTTDKIFLLHSLKKVTSELVWPFVMRGEEMSAQERKKIMYQFQKKREGKNREKISKAIPELCSKLTD